MSKPKDTMADTLGAVIDSELSMLKRATPQMAYAKMGLFGFQGSGKSFTAALVAEGIAELTGNKKLAFVDTETGSDFLLKRFEAAGLEVYRTKSRSFTDLLAVIKEAEAAGIGTLIIDSITHIWRDLCDSYDKKKQRGGRLQFQDWAVLKAEWRQYTDLFVNSKIHIIVCGRAGYEYDYDFNKDGSKDLIKTGTKMKVETEFGFEPSLVVEMERLTESKKEIQEISGDKKKKEAFKAKVGSKWIHRAHVLKDRTDTINGEAFDYPTFESFAPHFDALNIGGEHLGVDTTRDSADRFDTEGNSGWKRDQRARTIALEEIKEGMIALWPGQTGKEKAYKGTLLEVVFKTRSWTKVGSDPTTDSLEHVARVLPKFREMFVEMMTVDDFRELEPLVQIEKAWQEAEFAVSEHDDEVRAEAADQKEEAGC